MKIFFSRNYDSSRLTEEDLTPVSLREAMEKTREALDVAYAGFDNAVDVDMIDSYIYEINYLQKRYKHLTDLAALEPSAEAERSCQHSPIRALVSHVFG